jgi:tripartite-type tricarboxylate transporter receptor subunit TctC
MFRVRRIAQSLVCACGVFAHASGGFAADEDVAKFYEGKSITLLVGASAGGSFDAYARTFARHMPRFIPGNPNFIQSIPAAGGVVAANRLFNVAVRDGTVMASFQGSTAFEPLLNKGDFQFDARKLVWIGSLEKFVNVAITWHASPAKAFEDAFRREIILGATAAGSDSFVYPTVINMLLGTKFKLVTGYDSPAMYLAMERGEVDGRISTWTDLKGRQVDWLNKGKINLLAQIAAQPTPGLPAPMLLDYVKDESSRKLFALLLARQEGSRPFALPPGVPDARVQAIRKAFVDMINDPAVNEEAEIIGTPVNQPIDGEYLQALIEKAYATDPAIVEKVRTILGSP